MPPVHPPVIRHAGGLHVADVMLEPRAQVGGHRHDHPTLVLVIDGALTVRDGSGVRTLGPGAVDLVAPGRVRAVGAGRAGVRCAVISADRRQAVGRHAAWRLVAAPRWTPHDVLALVPRLRVALDARDSASPALEEAMLAILRHATRGHASRARAAWLDTALARLGTGAAHGGALRSVARELRIHPVHLARVVHAQLGITVREQLRRVRVARAIAMLGADHATMSSTAHRAGFADHAHLCREIARRIGVTPTRLRALLLSGDVASIQAEVFPGVHVGRVSRAPVRGRRS
jgi:AraC-like DNA-binding protein/quercetin dioxygenase-like cupin family protein